MNCGRTFSDFSFRPHAFETSAPAHLLRRAAFPDFLHRLDVESAQWWRRARDGGVGGGRLRHGPTGSGPALSPRAGRTSGVPGRADRALGREPPTNNHALVLV